FIFVYLLHKTCFACYLSFFFSSRRRHTRFSRDWSSDVCSSDLPGRPRSTRCSSAHASASVRRRPPRSSTQEPRHPRKRCSIARKIGRGSCRERGAKYGGRGKTTR